MKKYFNNILYDMAAESAVVGGGEGGNFDISVSMEGFESAIAAIKASTTAIQNAVTKAQTAATAAKDACDSDIGGAIESGISTPDLGNLKQALTDLDNLLASVTKLNTTYDDQKSRLLAAIRGASSGN